MRARPVAVWLTLCALLVSSPAWAQQHIADSAQMQQAVAAKASADETNRQVVRKVLDRSDVKALANQMGLDVRQAETAVGQLSGEELASLAQAASAAQADLAGGSNTVTISLTTLLLIIIIIILIAN